MSIDLERITHPLRLASGSHQAGTGRGCSMNVLSYIMGEPKISDFPKCSEPLLAKMVQCVNDRLASIPELCEGDDGLYTHVWFLSPEDSFRALDLAWSTVGTAGQPVDVHAVWMKRIQVEAWKRFAHEELSADSLADAQRLLNRGKVRDALSYITDSAYVVGIEALVEFVGWSIREFREIAALDVVADADPVVVNEAIAQMVTV